MAAGRRFSSAAYLQRTGRMIETLQPAFRDRLKSMYAGEPQQGSAGPVELNQQVRIPESSGMWLHDLCMSLKPARTLEVGMAYGFSTLYILAALAKLGAGHHTAIDPWQDELWHDVGLTNAVSVGMESHFSLIRERSISALARLAQEEQQFDLIFVDGDHRFDGTLVDFTLAAEVCPTGGSIVLDDAWMPAVNTVGSWVRSNRSDFKSVDCPEGWAHFQRVGKDQRQWDHFAEFSSRTSIPYRIARRVKRAVSSVRSG
jgi:predicted O-methyltransferase YrrM